MKQISLDNEKLLFLYAYLRHVDLSLDRSRWDCWIDLKRYFKGKIMPIKVIRYLTEGLGFPEVSELDKPDFLPKRNVFIKVIKSIFINGLKLEADELNLCLYLLKNLEERLNSDITKYNLEVEKIRIEIAKFYTHILQFAISRKDQNRLMKIEHFNSNVNIEIVEIEDFIPSDFKI